MEYVYYYARVPDKAFSSFYISKETYYVMMKMFEGEENQNYIQMLGKVDMDSVKIWWAKTKNEKTL